MGRSPDPAEKTSDLGRALSILVTLESFPPVTHLAQARHICGDNDVLFEQVKALLAPPPAPRHDVPDTAMLRLRRGPFDRYTIVDHLGEGGMGVVYKAVAHEPVRTVALKLLRPGAASVAVLRRFRREADLLARLDHPAIVRVLDFGWAATAAGREPYLAMEFVDGTPLLRTCDELRLGLRQRVALLVEVGEAIEHAHRRGVIHRDLKPENVLLTRQDGRLQPRLLDFGVAAVVAETADLATTVNHLVGTVAYMAPEQIDGEVDVRGDVWSLAVLGYELLTGHLPIDVRNQRLGLAIERIRNADPVPIESRNRRLRGDIAAVFRQALARNPDDRYQSVAAFVADLRRWLHHLPVHARTPTLLYVASRFVLRRKALSAALAVASVAIAVSVITLISGQARERQHATLLRLLGQLVSSAQIRHQGIADPDPDHDLEVLEQAFGDLVRFAPDDVTLSPPWADLVRLRGIKARNRGNHDAAAGWRRQEVAIRRRIADLSPSPTSSLELATALILVGDIDKERGTPATMRRALAPYETAHATLLALHASDPDDRRYLDDLGHSHLRLAELCCALRDLPTAARHIDLAAPIVERLQREHADAWQTHALLREFFGVSDFVATSSGEHGRHLEDLTRMCQHAIERARLRPAAESYSVLAASALAAAGVSLEHGDLLRARAFAQHGDDATASLLALDPQHLHAQELTLRLRLRRAEIESRAGDHPAVLDHLRRAMVPLPRLQQVPEPPNHERCLDAAQWTLLHCVLAMPEEPRLATAGRHLLGDWGAMVVDRKPETTTAAILVVLQVLFGDETDRAVAAAELRLIDAAGNGNEVHLLAAALLARGSDPDRAIAGFTQLQATANDPAIRRRAVAELQQLQPRGR